MWKKALYYVWILYSAPALLAVLFTALLPDQLIYTTTPKCYSVKQFGRECFMCGSTRSFVALGNADLPSAWQLNRIAVVLYCTIIINSIVLCIYLVIKNKTHKL
ncbi:MAG: DUF2752 domain-containing protein [Bacteroidia bacterium]